MTLVVMGVDALDPDLVDERRHPNLALDSHTAIKTINASSGAPSTHELWPTIITGLPPAEHGLLLDNGVAWDSPLLRKASSLADRGLPDSVQTRVGAWILNNTSEDAFRAPATYYEEQGIETVFEGRNAKAIGVPNYVVDPDDTDREHDLRRRMGDLFKRDPDLETGHETSDVAAFYEQCLEMVMIRIARIRRALRSRCYELVFGYTSGLDLVGHVAYDDQVIQERAYDETDEFVGELRSDLETGDELLLVSDHGLQNGVHTEQAMVAATDSDLLADVDSILDVRAAIEAELRRGDHSPRGPDTDSKRATIGTAGAADAGEDTDGGREKVREHLDDLGYL